MKFFDIKYNLLVDMQLERNYDVRISHNLWFSFEFWRSCPGLQPRLASSYSVFVAQVSCLLLLGLWSARVINTHQACMATHSLVTFINEGQMKPSPKMYAPP